MTSIESIVILRHLYYQQTYNPSTSPSESVDTSSFNIDYKMFLDSSVKPNVSSEWITYFIPILDPFMP